MLDLAGFVKDYVTIARMGGAERGEASKRNVPDSSQNRGTLVRAALPQEAARGWQPRSSPRKPLATES
jgi:hypothetical protein